MRQPCESRAVFFKALQKANMRGIKKKSRNPGGVPALTLLSILALNQKPKKLIFSLRQLC